MFGFAAGATALIEQDLDGLEGLAVNHGRMLTGVDDILMRDVAHIEGIAQKMIGGPAFNGQAALRLAGTVGPTLGDNAALGHLHDQPVDGFQLQIPLEHPAHRLGLIGVDAQGAAIGVIA